ncbi:fibropellin-1-like [Lytechinus pictus]|uniref:fibropellin-1-like n=1 Tax=Lytechinus pictus TaxID=7653 RepID=UPI0030B9EB93
MDGAMPMRESRYAADGSLDPNVEEKLNLGIQWGHLQTKKREKRAKKQRDILRILLAGLALMVCAVIALGLALYFTIRDQSSNPIESTTGAMLGTTSGTYLTTPKGIPPGFNTTEIEIMISLNDRNFTSDLNDNTSMAYVEISNNVINAVDKQYVNDTSYVGTSILRISPGSIQVVVIVLFQVPMEEEERVQLITVILSELQNNMIEAANSISNDTSVEVITSGCETEPCANGGECTAVGSNSVEYTCTCAAGYMGSSCLSDIDECAIVGACSNRGVCDNTIGSYSCECISGWQGTDCDNDVDECEIESPCRNGAVCNNIPGSFDCECAPGYTGSVCELEINECESNPCLNDGECVNEEGAYSCRCSAGFTGDTCEKNIDDCDPNLCENGAACVDGINSFTCQCVDGYTGFQCESDIDDCDPNLCENGAACVDGINSFTCQCVDGYTGFQCESGIS